MENIFKINIEPKINYENIDFITIKNILKNLRLNILEEIKCLSFIKQSIENKNNINGDKNVEINEKLIQKYTLILNKLNELCIEEINYISETIITINSKIKEIKHNKDFNLIIDDNLYDKIDLTVNNYNKIIENINKTLSSLPYIFNLYLIYNKIEEEENIFIRNNIEKEEENYKLEINNNINEIQKTKNLKREEEKDETIIKREKMIKFSESVKNINNKKIIRHKKQFSNEKDLQKINMIINNKNQLQKKIKELENGKEEIKSFIFKNCIKQNEIKIFNKIKGDNRILNEEIINLKILFQELNNRYEKENKKLENLKKERIDLENENSKLIEFIKNIFREKEISQKIKNNIDYNFKDDKSKAVTNCQIQIDSNNNSADYNSEDKYNININPNNFESTEMLKRFYKF